MTDLLDTVKAALERKVYQRSVANDIRALVAEVEAERIENAHLREACTVMERAANERESDLAALRQRHAAAVERAFREGHLKATFTVPEEAAWLASEAKARLTKETACRRNPSDT